MANEESDQNKTTIYDVADRAGVAISTVSRVLNNSRDVSDATRDTVMQAIRELKFRPNRTAKNLAQRSTPTIAVAVPTFTTPFHNELLKGVRSKLDDAEVDLLLCDLDWEAPKATLRNFLARGAMDGLLLAGLPIDEEIGQELKTLGAPIVLIGTQWEEMDSFYWEEKAGAHLATRHLLEQGHERIGVITPRESPAKRPDSGLQRSPRGRRPSVRQRHHRLRKNQEARRLQRGGRLRSHAGSSERR
jgi:LacI family transcriptional regulator